jgi:hypothetical protein
LLGGVSKTAFELRQAFLCATEPLQRKTKAEPCIHIAGRELERTARVLKRGLVVMFMGRKIGAQQHQSF